MRRARLILVAGAAHYLLTLLATSLQVLSIIGQLGRGQAGQGYEPIFADHVIAVVARVLGAPLLTGAEALGVYAPSVAAFYGAVLLNTLVWVAAGLLVLRWRGRSARRLAAH